MRIKTTLFFNFIWNIFFIYKMYIILIGLSSRVIAKNTPRCLFCMKEELFWSIVLRNGTISIRFMFVIKTHFPFVTNKQKKTKHDTDNLADIIKKSSLFCIRLACLCSKTYFPFKIISIIKLEANQTKTIICSNFESIYHRQHHYDYRVYYVFSIFKNHTHTHKIEVDVLKNEWSIFNNKRCKLVSISEEKGSGWAGWVGRSKWEGEK